MPTAAFIASALVVTLLVAFALFRAAAVLEEAAK